MITIEISSCAHPTTRTQKRNVQNKTKKSIIQKEFNKISPSKINKLIRFLKKRKKGKKKSLLLFSFFLHVWQITRLKFIKK